MEDILFYSIAFLIIAFSVLVVSLNHLLHSALALIASFSATAGLYILLGAEFVAITQVLVYIGGIIIFIVFAILLTSQLGEKFLLPSHLKIILSLLVSLCILFFFFHLFGQMEELKDPMTRASVQVGKMREIGTRFLSTDKAGFIIPFEVISVLLLAAMLGAIVIARKSKEDKT